LNNSYTNIILLISHDLSQIKHWVRHYYWDWISSVSI